MLTPNGVGFCTYLLRVGFLGPRVWVSRVHAFFVGFGLPEHKPDAQTKTYETGIFFFPNCESNFQDAGLNRDFKK